MAKQVRKQEARQTQMLFCRAHSQPADMNLVKQGVADLVGGDLSFKAQASGIIGCFQAGCQADLIHLPGLFKTFVVKPTYFRKLVSAAEADICSLSIWCGALPFGRVGK